MWKWLVRLLGQGSADGAAIELERQSQSLRLELEERERVEQLPQAAGVGQVGVHGPDSVHVATHEEPVGPGPEPGGSQDAEVGKRFDGHRAQVGDLCPPSSTTRATRL